MNFKKRIGFIFVLFIFSFVCIWFLIKDVSENKVPFENNKFVEDKYGLDIAKQVTLILRHYNYFDNEVKFTIKCIKKLYPALAVIIVSDHALPLNEWKNLRNTHFVHLDLDLMNLPSKKKIMVLVETPFVFIALPGSYLNLSSDFDDMISAYNHVGQDNLMLISSNKDKLKCQKLKLNLMEWTATYQRGFLNETCDITDWSYSFFTTLNLLGKIDEPFANPFPEPLYFQAKVLGFPLKVSDLMLPRKIMSNAKIDVLRQSQRTNMYYNFGIKKVIRHGKDADYIEWYGCTRNTSRCFGTVYNSTPDYLIRGRWTPPCCLKVLRETGHHVFKSLEDFSIRYWLEGGSLLGAMRHSDIIPWDYDIDIGVYEEDLKKHPYLRKLNRQRLKKLISIPIKDPDGFVWELAKPDEGGDFFRVQASVRNRLHVDIFPFRSRKGQMVRNSYLWGHPQDRAFSEHFLKPLTTVPFIGLSKVYAPNNIREFLEFKFGKGCIESPEYPNPKIVSYKNPHDLVNN